jgi:hypothetical protein
MGRGYGVERGLRGHPRNPKEGKMNECLRPNITYNITINVTSPMQFDQRRPRRNLLCLWLSSVWRLFVNWFTFHP